MWKWIKEALTFRSYEEQNRAADREELLTCLELMRQFWIAWDAYREHPKSAAYWVAARRKLQQANRYGADCRYDLDEQETELRIR